MSRADVGERPRLALLVMGLPTANNPARGIFNLRAAKLISTIADVTIIFLRTWLPKRPLAATSQYDGMNVVTLAIPQLPRAGTLNLTLYDQLGWPLTRSLLRSCDLIHSVSADFCGVVGSRWAVRAGIPHVAQVIGSDIHLLRRRFRTEKLATWDKGVDVAVCNSAALAQQLSEMYPRCPVRVVYRGADLAKFNPRVPPSGPLASAKPVRFLFLGGFDHHGANIKGGSMLLAAWQQAEESLWASGASLLLAGKESQSATVRQWRSGLRYPQMVHLGGVIDPAEVAGIMCASDVLLVPSMREGLPNAVVEASACGRAVVGSNVGGVPEVIVDGETGLLLPPGDVAAWRSTLIKATTDPSSLVRMGEMARIRMEKLFDATEYPQKMMDVYASLLHRPRFAATSDQNELTVPNRCGDL